MRHYIIAGCDQHNVTLNVCVAIDKEKPRSTTFGNDPKGREKLLQTLLALARKVGVERHDIHFAYEASRFGFGLHDQLSAVGIHCYVVAATRIPRSPRALVDKTDDKDSKLICELLRGAVLAGNELPTVWVPGRQLRDEREITRARGDLVEKSTCIKNQITGMLARFEIRKPKDVGGNWTAGHYRWLCGLCEGQEPRLRTWARKNLKRLLQEYSFYKEQIEEVEKQINLLAQDVRYKEPLERLRKIKGVNVITGMVFLAELGDLDRFSNRNQIGAYLGLVPVVHESGQADDRKGHITGQGPARLRQLLCQACWSWIRWDPRARERFHRHLRRNGGQRKKAAVAMMRRLAILMWHAAREGLHSWAV